MAKHGLKKMTAAKKARLLEAAQEEAEEALALQERLAAINETKVRAHARARACVCVCVCVRSLSLLRVCVGCERGCMCKCTCRWLCTWMHVLMVVWMHVWMHV